MQAVPDAFLAGIVVGVGRRLLGAEDMVEPAGDEKAREGARKGEALFALVFVKIGPPEAGRRMPSDRLAPEVAFRDVERAINEHGEAKAGACAELQDADAALDAVAERHQANARELRERSRMFGKLPAGKRAAVERDHGGGPRTV